MYLSRIPINPFKAKTQQAFSNLNIFHGAIEKAVNQTEARKLWRLDFLDNNWYLLLVTDTKPDLKHLQGEFGFTDQPGSSKKYDSYLESIQKGRKYYFRVVLNPTVTQSPAEEFNSKGKLKKGKVTAVTDENQLINWFIEKGKRFGFAVSQYSSFHDEKIPTFQIEETKHVRIEKGKQKKTFSFFSADISGILIVEDEEKFKECLKTGIGREKAYGQGLLTTIPVAPSTC